MASEDASRAGGIRSSVLMCEGIAGVASLEMLAEESCTFRSKMREEAAESVLGEVARVGCMVAAKEGYG